MKLKLNDFSERLGAFYQQDDIGTKIVSLSTLLKEIKDYFFTEYDKVDDDEFSSVMYMSHLKPADRKKKLGDDLEKRLEEAEALIKGACVYGILDGKEKFYNYFYSSNDF